MPNVVMRVPRILFVLIAFVGLRAVPGWADETTTQNLIQVEVISLNSNNGKVNCALFRSAEGFPNDSALAIGTASATIEGERAACTFANVPSGDYAVSVFHDENSNGKLDTNFIGMPKEGVGASNDAAGHFGPPRFDDARFSYSGGLKVLTIHIRYLIAPL